MRVCHVCSAHYADDGRVFDRACRSLAAAGVDVHLIARTKMIETYKLDGVTIHPSPSNRSRVARLFISARVARLAKSIDPDVFHVHEPELLPWVIGVAAGRPVIWDVHEPYGPKILEREWIPRPLAGFASKSWTTIESKLLPKCAAVITVSDEMAQGYYDRHKVVRVVANYPRASLFAQDNSSQRRADACVFTGLIEPNSGVGEAIRAIGILSRKGLRVTFDLAGVFRTPDYEQELTTLVREEGLEGQVVFHGIVPRAEALRLQAISGIGLNLSLPDAGSDVGFPVKMLEFMATGLPIVYSDLPTFRKIAGKANAGIAVRPGSVAEIAEAIEQLVRYPDVAMKLGQLGRQAIFREFNWDTQWQTMRELYTTVTGVSIEEVSSVQ